MVLFRRVVVFPAFAFRHLTLHHEEGVLGDVGGMVTDACVSPDQKRLAILTYRNVWVFDVPGVGEDFFRAPALHAPISPPTLSWQVEACSWVDNGHLFLGSEQGDLFRIALTDLREAK